MYQARNRTELILEVWETLDCESIGASEIVAIEKAVAERFGPAAVDSPMVIARMLADEGAVLRHPEIMKLYVDRSVITEYDAALRNAIDLSGPEEAHRSIKRLESLRQKYHSENDKEGMRLLRERAIAARADAEKRIADRRLSPTGKAAISEAREWLGIWLASPEVFENWVEVRRSTKEFAERFGRSHPESDDA
jgi:hypothetical protein